MSPDIEVLRDHLGYLLRRAQLWVFQDISRALAPVDLTAAEYSVLVVVGANPGLSQSAVGSTLGIERARLVRLIDHFESRGLAQRRASKTDRRSHALHLTPEGTDLLAEAKQLARLHEERVIARFGAERRADLVRCLQGFDDEGGF